jgi:hypothetical protein
MLRRVNRTMRRTYLLLAALLLVLAGCRPSGVRELTLPAVLETPVSPRPGSFCLAAGPTAPYLTYIDRDSRALVLSAVDGSSPAAYLDRITDLPEQDPLSGIHLLFAAGDELHLLYLDRQSEESLLLKHVRKAMESGTAWIDVLPGSGKPIAAFPTSGGLDVFLEQDQEMWREGPRAGLVRSPFRSEGASSRFAAHGFQGFTVYDAATHQLLLFLLQGQEVETLEVARFGQAQDSAVDPEGRLQILAYDPRSYRIVLHQTADPASGFEVRPVTLSRGTSSLALVHLPGGPGFLFNEVSARRRPRHQVCLLHFWPEEGYVKTVLYRSERPTTALRACLQRDALFVALLEDNLRVLRVEYDALRKR